MTKIVARMETMVGKVLALMSGTKVDMSMTNKVVDMLLMDKMVGTGSMMLNMMVQMVLVLMTRTVVGTDSMTTNMMVQTE